MDVYNFYLTVDKINFKDEADGLKPFLFKNIGILQSFFFLLVALGFQLNASHFLGFLSHFLSLDSCTSPFALSLFFR
jgi:hypothetical protein